MIASCIRPHKAAIVPGRIHVEICFGPMTFIKSRLVIKGLFILVDDERLVIDIQDQSFKGYREILFGYSHKSSEANDHIFNVTLVDIEHDVHNLTHVIASLVVHFVPNNRRRSQYPYRVIGMLACMVLAC